MGLMVVYCCVFDEFINLLAIISLYLGDISVGLLDVLA